MTIERAALELGYDCALDDAPEICLPDLPAGGAGGAGGAGCDGAAASR